MKNIVNIHDNRATDKIDEPKAFSRFDDDLIRKSDHLKQIEHLMDNQDAGLRLAIDNLILTYGVQAVRRSLKSTDLKTIQKAKKVA